VIGGAIALTDANYVDQLVRCGARHWMDALSVHPYSVTFPGALWGSPSTSGLTAVHNVARLPLWVTEFGYPAGTPQATAWDESAVRKFSALPWVHLVSLYCLSGPYVIPDLSRFG